MDNKLKKTLFQKINTLKIMDEKLFSHIYLMCNKTQKRTLFFDNLNTLSKPFFIIVFIFYCIFLYRLQNPYLYTFIILPLILLLINIILRKTLKRTRPYNNSNLNLSNLSQSNSFSLPSNHASSSIVISLFIIPINPLGYILLILAFITSFSRLARGYHYPCDIALSTILALTMFIISHII